MGGEEWTWDGKASTDLQGGFWAPRALSEAEIQELVQDWAKAAVRAVKAGVDVIEIHAAHGYLIHQFLSPISNRRTDSYGGSFENRTRLLMEIIEAIRKVIPSTMPLFLRISATEWHESSELGRQFGSWDIDSSIRLAKLLPALGIDLLDVSSAGNNPQAKIPMHNSYQVSLAERIRASLRADNLDLLIGAVGLITEAEQARDILEEGGAARIAGTKVDAELDKEASAAVEMTEKKDGKEPMADVVLVARQFMREPEWVMRVAHKLGVDIAWPSQFLRVRFPKL
jgi:2,4-dienoyl-CoA reductase-like NADH-dependent reductase (Old Yellow Enzyme family)